MFFFKRLKINETDRYPEFPYLSPCGRERNFIRCDDKAVVYTHIIPQPESEFDLLAFGGAGNHSDLTVNFEPERICMLPNTGRVYYPCSVDLGGVGLVKSSIAIDISKHFDFDQGEDNSPTHFNWRDQKYLLTNELLPLMELSAPKARDFLSKDNYIL